MASKRPVRLLQRTCSSTLRPSITSSTTPPTRCFSATAPVLITPEVDIELQPRPRWQQTPRAMVAPVRLNPMPRQGIMKVNSDPRRLDDVYRRMLGEDGDRLLSEETKWLAVTHKSFDHGRRGFNDRLTFLGKRILDLQTSLALLNRRPGGAAAEKELPEEEEREMFKHPSLVGLPNLTQEARENVLDKERLATIGKQWGLHTVIRWRPRMALNLTASGEDQVISGTICAIIGALALERGGEVANQVVKDKILQPLGLHS